MIFNSCGVATGICACLLLGSFGLRIVTGEAVISPSRSALRITSLSSWNALNRGVGSIGVSSHLWMSASVIEAMALPTNGALSRWARYSRCLRFVASANGCPSLRRQFSTYSVA